MTGLVLWISHVRCGKQKCWPRAPLLVPGNSVLRLENIFLASSSPLLHYFIHPPQPPHPSASHYCPACHSILFFNSPVSCPSACLARRICRLSPPSWPPTCLALVHSMFESRNFSTLSHPNEYHRQCKRDRLLAPLSGAWPSCKLWKSEAEEKSPAWSEVETCSGSMKTSGDQLLKWKESPSYPLSICKFSFTKVCNVAKFGQIFRGARGLSLVRSNPLTSSSSKEEGCQSFSKKRSQLLFNLDKTMNFSLPSLLETAEFVDVFQKVQPEADTWHGKFHSKWL